MAALYQRSLILTHFMGANRFVRAGAARSAMQAPSGKRRNTPGGPICPTHEAGRFWPPASSLVA